MKGSELVDKQGEAFDEIAAAQKIEAIPSELRTHTQRQELYVALAAQRCPRCGSQVVSLFPSPAALCSTCTAYLRSLDAPIRWFVDLLNEARGK